MKVAIIAPIKLLEDCCTTKIQYILPYFVVGSQEYREFYRKRERAGDYIILDSVRPGWKREPEDFELVKQACKLITPSLIIYPSYMYNVGKTVSIATRFADELKVVGAVCLEGTTTEEVEECKKEVRPFYTYAIPSHLYKVCKYFLCGKPLVWIENHLEIEELKPEWGGVLATSLPVRLGLKGRLVTDYLPSPPSLTFLEEDRTFMKVVQRNIRETVQYYEL